MASWLKRATQLFAAFTVICFSFINSTQAQTPDPINGKALYNTAVAGLSCASAGCHGADPSLNINKVRNGANNSIIIQSAINSNVGGMAFFRGAFTTVQIADIAAYIANPNTTPPGPAVGLSTTSLVFGSTVVNSSASPMVVTVTNTGNALLTISNAVVTGVNPSEFSIISNCSNLNPATGCTITVIFTPNSVGVKTATLILTHNAPGGSDTVALAGTGVATAPATIALSASTVDFGMVQPGSSTFRTITVMNTGSSPATVSSLSTSSTPAGAFVYLPGCELFSPLAPGASCNLPFNFQAPTIPGGYTGIHTFATNAAGSPYSINLIGTVAAAPNSAITVTPNGVNFGNVQVGSSASQTVVVGGPGLTIYGIQSSMPNSAFTFSGCSNTVIVFSCNLTITYTPTAAGADNGMLLIPSNASNIQQYFLPMNGSGIAPPPLDPLVITLTPATQDFGTAKLNTAAATKTFTVTNTGKPNFIYSGANFSGVNSVDFSVLNTGTCTNGLTLLTSASCTVDVGFVPTATGARTATLTLLSTQTNPTGLPSFVPPSASLSGTGVTESNGLIEFTQDGLAISSVKVSADGKVTKLTLKNNGIASFKVTNITFLVNKNNYKITDECSGKTLKRGATCEIKLQYIGPALLAGAAAPAAELIMITTDSGAQKMIPISVTPADVSASSSAATPKSGGCTVGNADDMDLSHLAMLAMALGALALRRKRTHKQD
jgi:mono/diheme cytochrome c family protein